MPLVLQQLNWDKKPGVLLRPGGRLEHFYYGIETSRKPTQDGFQVLNE